MTGVQTCALPISTLHEESSPAIRARIGKNTERFNALGRMLAAFEQTQSGIEMQISQQGMGERRSVERELEHFTPRATVRMKQAETQRRRQPFPIGIDRNRARSGPCHDSALLFPNRRFTAVDQILQRLRTGETKLIDPRLTILGRFKGFWGALS